MTAQARARSSCTGGRQEEILLGGELNAEVEAVHATTEGSREPIGESGAAVADTLGKPQR